MNTPSTMDPAYKSGFVAVMGKPNVGKSTLMNTLLGQKVAAVSPRPQTTRKRQMGILSLDAAQIIFIDTPGVHQARHKLGESMNQEALDTLEECDAIIFMVDAQQEPDEEDRLLADHLLALKRPIPSMLVLNKVESLDEATLDARRDAYTALAPAAEVALISARDGQGVDDLLARLVERLPQGYPFFPEGQVTDLYEREIAADLIRETALNILRDEVPHGIAIRIDEYTERGDHGAYIEATLFVEKDSHKGIVIGKDGSMLKRLGATARREIEAMSDRKVFLRLRVKVRKNWRNDENVLRWFGY